MLSWWKTERKIFDFRFCSLALKKDNLFFGNMSKKCTFWLVRGEWKSPLFFCWNFRMFPAIGLERNWHYYECQKSTLFRHVIKKIYWLFQCPKCQIWNKKFFFPLFIMVMLTFLKCLQVKCKSYKIYRYYFKTFMWNSNLVGIFLEKSPDSAGMIVSKILWLCVSYKHSLWFAKKEVCSGSCAHKQIKQRLQWVIQRS